MISLLDRLAEALEAATPGPWHVTNLQLVAGGRKFPSFGAFPFGREQGAAVVGTTEPAYAKQPAESDAALIVAAVNALPALLQVARAAEAYSAEMDAHPRITVLPGGTFAELQAALDALGGDSQ